MYMGGGNQKVVWIVALALAGGACGKGTDDPNQSNNPIGIGGMTAGTMPAPSGGTTGTTGGTTAAPTGGMTAGTAATGTGGTMAPGPTGGTMAPDPTGGTMAPDPTGGTMAPDPTGGTMAVPTGGTGGPGGLPGDHCLAGITNFDSDGPFEYDTARSGSINFWVPKVPSGCKVPVIHVANGTGATCSFYAAAIRRQASHGFLTACYENANTGAGTQGLQALQTALEMYPEIADHKFGSTGHSQGGQASFVVLQYAEKEWGDQGVYAGLAMQPASGFGSQPREGWRQVYGMIKSPMFMFSGQGSDGLVSQRWVQDAFDALPDSIEAYFWAKAGSNHFSPNGPQMEVSIAWWRWKLLGDQAACRHFKMVGMDSSWEIADVQNEAECM